MQSRRHSKRRNAQWIDLLLALEASHKVKLANVEQSIPVVMTPTSASEDEVKRYELFCSAASREAYLLNQSTLFVLLAQSILMAASVTNASGGSRFLVCSLAIVGALIMIATISTMVSGDGRIKSQWRVYLKGIASEGEIIC